MATIVGTCRKRNAADLFNKLAITLHVELTLIIRRKARNKIGVLMIIKTETIQDCSPKSLAKSLADADPKEFADFWFAFNEACDKEKLNRFAQAMAPDLGANRKRPLQELCRLMEFHVIKRELEKI